MSYYRKFKIFIGNPIWRLYLRWAYKKCVNDLGSLRAKPSFSKPGFTCLLCGVGSEVTADEFIKFVLSQNKKPEIKIIDLGDEQIEAVKKLIDSKYPNLDIEVKQIDALKLCSFIQVNSIDWIETDGFFEYFNHKSLKELLLIWKKLLTKDGFITTRACSSQGLMDQIIDSLRLWLGKTWLNVTLYSHRRQELKKLFKLTGFRYVEGFTFIPTLKRYSLITK